MTKRIALIDQLPHQICRNVFCENCARLGRPRKNNFFALFLGNHKRFNIQELVRGVSEDRLGFTPHLFTKSGVIAELPQGPGIEQEINVVVQKQCLIHGCGLTISYDKIADKYDLHGRHNSIFHMSLSQWIALHRFTNTGYEIGMYHGTSHHFWKDRLELEYHDRGF